MLTPKFSLKQSSDYLLIQLHVPYINLASAECDVNGDEFYFSAKPYYLRLHLPGNVVNNDKLKSEYDSEKKDLTIHVAKEIPGQHFEGLDMLTKLLTPKQQVGIPNIEVIGSQSQQDEEEVEGAYSKLHEVDSDSTHAGATCSSTDNEEDNVFDWFVKQEVPAESDSLPTKSHYGFAHQKCDVINRVCSEINMIDLKDPDNVRVPDRKILRQKQEEDKFDCEHYLADLFDDALIEGIISANYPHLTGSCSDNEFSDEEKERLMKLPHREYLIEQDFLPQLYLGLVDLVYAYSYNYRFCGGDNNVESDWTICKLSSTLSWFDSFINLKEVLISCARRTFCFPFYRSWKLFVKVMTDVETIFKGGKHQILKCLSGIHSILESSENFYPLNDLYITDYCVWIQSSDSRRINSLAAALSQMKITKVDVGFSISELEAEAESLMAECGSDDEGDETVEELSKKMINVVHLADAVCSDSDDDADNDTESGSECSDTSTDEDEGAKINSDDNNTEKKEENDQEQELNTKS